MRPMLSLLHAKPARLSGASGQGGKSRTRFLSQGEVQEDEISRTEPRGLAQLEKDSSPAVPALDYALLFEVTQGARG